MEAEARPADRDQERRWITVLFCDLVGSTELSGRLDPEEFGEILGAYHEVAGQQITRFAGHVDQFLGDGIVAFFGYPSAQDDAAEHAVRAGLGIIDAVAALNASRRFPHRLAVRVGVHSGPVVVGAGADGRTPGAKGETTNIAARIQGVAAPDTVAISDATYRVVEGVFDVSSLGTPSMKGVRESIAVYRVLTARQVRRRFGAAAHRGLAPFVDRTAERALVRSRWKDAVAGRGQVVTIIGEPGIGKSRLIRDFHDDMGDAPYAWNECEGVPYQQGTPFAPIIDLLRGLFGWGGDVATAERLDTLDRALAATGMVVPETAPLIATMLGVPGVEERYPPLLLSPEQRRRRLLEAIVAWVVGGARAQPSVIMVEDLQWVDPSTLEVIDKLLAAIVEVPVLVVLTARPEFVAPWSPAPHHATIALDRLDEPTIRDLVGATAASMLASSAMVDAIVERSDGIPFFVEELVRAVLDEARETSASAIPATLHDSLAARLDRLGAAKETAQIASVLGREFPASLLRAVWPGSAEALDATLATLTDAELLRVTGAEPNVSCRFEHSLVQQAAYESLLRSRRRELHRAVADAMTTQHASTFATSPERLAHHLTEAGDHARALEAWRDAAEHATERFALAEAEQHYQSALAMIEAGGADLASNELPIQLALGKILWGTRGFASPEAAACFERARVLGEAFGGEHRVMVLMGLWAALVGRGELRAARELVAQMLPAVVSTSSESVAAWAHYADAATAYGSGDIARAREAIVRVIGDAGLPETVGTDMDARVSGMVHAVLIAWHDGEIDRARSLAGGYVDRARESSPFVFAMALMTACTLGIYLGDLEGVRRHAAQLDAVAAEQNLPLFAGWADLYRGWLLTADGRPADGVVALRRGLATYMGTGQRTGVGWYLGWLAEAQLGAGLLDDALATVGDAFGAVPDEVIHFPYLLRVRGDVERAMAGTLGPCARAEETYREALTLARRFGSHMMSARIERCLADLTRPASGPPGATVAP